MSDTPEVTTTPAGAPDGAEAAAHPAPQPGGRIVWNEASLQQNYANVATVMATQEEFSILFGTQQGLRPDPRGMQVDLTNRMMVSPFLAKRLLKVLERTVAQYEDRFGKINVEG